MFYRNVYICERLVTETGISSNAWGTSRWGPTTLHVNKALITIPKPRYSWKPELTVARPKKATKQWIPMKFVGKKLSVWAYLCVLTNWQVLLLMPFSLIDEYISLDIHYACRMVMFIINRSNYVFVVDDESSFAAFTALMSGTIPISNDGHTCSCWKELVVNLSGTLRTVRKNWKRKIYILSIR